MLVLTVRDHGSVLCRPSGLLAGFCVLMKELDEFLLARAVEHDSPSLLFTLACEHLRSSRVIRLGVVKLLERVATARAEAGRETYARVAHLLTAKMVPELDGLLQVDAAG
jgi:hypothetical protein